MQKERQYMQLEMRKVRLDSADVKRIYFDAFPKKERMPFPMMVAMSKLWHTQFWSFYDGDTLCGFVYLARSRKIVFIMFLAVCESLRQKGYGSAILREIRSKYPDKKIIVSIEPCDGGASDLTVRERRKAFYGKNGYRETGYRMKLGGVEQEILIAGGDFARKEFRAFFVLYSNGTMWPKIWEQMGR